MQGSSGSGPATGYPAPPYHHPNSGQAPPPGFSYSYAAPPPRQPQYYYPNTHSDYAPLRTFLRAFFATVAVLAAIFGFIAVVTWLVLRPSLPHFLVDSLSLTNFSVNPQSVSGTCQVGFLVRNGNKKLTVEYGALQSSVFYDSTYLSETRLAPFKLGTKSQTTLNATFYLINAYVDRRVADDINRERAHGIVTFDVQVLAYASFRSGSWRFGERGVKVLCRRVGIGISSNSTSGTLVGGARECQVWT